MSESRQIPGLTLLDIPAVGHEFLQRVYDHLRDQGIPSPRVTALVALRTAPTLLWVTHESPCSLDRLIVDYDDLFMLPVGAHVVDEVGFMWRKLFAFDDPATRGWVCLTNVEADGEGHPVMQAESPDFITSAQGPLSFGFCLALDVPEGYHITFKYPD